MPVLHFQAMRTKQRSWDRGGKADHFLLKTKSPRQTRRADKASEGGRHKPRCFLWSKNCWRGTAGKKHVREERDRILLRPSVGSMGKALRLLERSMAVGQIRRGQSYPPPDPREIWGAGAPKAATQVTLDWSEGLQGTQSWGPQMPGTAPGERELLLSLSLLPLFPYGQILSCSHLLSHTHKMLF